MNTSGKNERVSEEEMDAVMNSPQLSYWVAREVWRIFFRTGGRVNWMRLNAEHCGVEEGMETALKLIKERRKRNEQN